jgi:hemolysin activation/secretion protein
MNTKAILTAALLCLGAAPGAAWAQPGPLIIDQNRADRRPPAPAPRKPSPPGGQAINAAPRDIQPFTLTSVRLEGASIPPGLVGGVFRTFVGQRMDAAGLTRLTQAAAAAYAKSDVALYTVLLPDQTFEGGVVRLRVIEGYIAHVTVKDEGGAGKDIGLVRRYAAPVLRERPLSAATVQRSILLIRDIPGLKADVQFLRGASSGAVELAIAIMRKPFEVGLSINNQGTSELGTTQIGIDLVANSLIRAGDQTRFTVAFPTDTERFQYYALSHSEILNDSGLTASANIGYLTTLPKSIPVRGSAETAGIALSYPVIRGNLRNLSLTGSLDGVNSDDALFGQAISSDHTRAFRAAAAYNRTHGCLTLAVSATASFGLDAFGAHVTSPYLSDATFKKLNGRVAVDFRMTPQWVLRLRGIGQFSDDRLPAVEQIPLGGEEFGRAFESATVIGDKGVAGSAEVAYAPKNLPHPVRGSELFGFVDDGEVWTNNRVIIPAQTFQLSSAGLGVRVAVLDKSIVQLEAAKAIKDDSGDNTNDPWRFLVSFRSAY